MTANGQKDTVTADAEFNLKIADSELHFKHDGLHGP